MTAHRDIVILGAGRVLQAFLGLLTLRLMTELLIPSEVGRLNLLQAGVGGFSLLLIAPVGAYLQRHAVEWRIEGRLWREFLAFAAYLALLPLILIPIMLVLRDAVALVMTIGLGWLLWLVNGHLVLVSLQQDIAAMLNTISRRGWFVLLSNLALALGLIVASLSVVLFSTTAEWWFNGLLAGHLLLLPGAIYLIWHYRRVRDALPVRSPAPGFWSREIFAFSWPMAVGTAFYWLQSSGYRFVLASNTSEATVGFFAVGFAIGAAPLAMFDRLAMDYLMPRFYQETPHSDARTKAAAWNRLVSTYWPLALVSSGLVGASGVFLARLLVGPAFWQVSWLAGWGAATQTLLIAYSCYVQMARAVLNNRVLILPSVVGGGCALAGTLVLSRWEPLLGTAIALMLAMLLTLLVAAVRLHKLFPLRLPWRGIGVGLAMGGGAVGLMGWLTSLVSDPGLVESLLVLLLGGTYWTACVWALSRMRLSEA